MVPVLAGTAGAPPILISDGPLSSALSKKVARGRTLPHLIERDETHDEHLSKSLSGAVPPQAVAGGASRQGVLVRLRSPLASLRYVIDFPVAFGTLCPPSALEDDRIATEVTVAVRLLEDRPERCVPHGLIFARRSGSVKAGSGAW